MTKDEVRELLMGLSDEDLEVVRREAGYLQGNRLLQKKLAGIKEREAGEGKVLHGTFREYLEKVNLGYCGYGDPESDPYVYSLDESGDDSHLSYCTTGTIDGHYVDWGDDCTFEEEIEASTLERDWVLPAEV
jgi:hypothetical protein